MVFVVIKMCQLEDTQTLLLTKFNAYGKFRLFI